MDVDREMNLGLLSAIIYIKIFKLNYEKTYSPCANLQENKM